MALNTMTKTIFVISSIVGMASITGCSTYASLAKEEDVKVERVNSGSANITRAHLQATETTLVLRGELKRRIPSRGPIPGHLHIELIGPDGEVFKEANIGYKRKNTKSRFAKFYLPIPSDLTKISALRVIHHDARSHIADSEKSPWRDVSQSK